MTRDYKLYLEVEGQPTDPEGDDYESDSGVEALTEEGKAGWKEGPGLVSDVHFASYEDADIARDWLLWAWRYRDRIGVLMEDEEMPDISVVNCTSVQP